jgi:hypothetical protein
MLLSTKSLFIAVIHSKHVHTLCEKIHRYRTLKQVIMGFKGLEDRELRT